MRRIFQMVLLLTLLAGTGGVAAAQPDQPAAQEVSSVEERRILVDIEKRTQRLDEREEQLDRREMQLKTLQGEVDKKLAALQTLREELVALFERKTREENERIGELSRIYEKMDPEKAAVLIRELDHQLAVDLLIGIKKKTAGRILNNLDAGTATELSKAFTEMPLGGQSDI